MEAKPDPVTPNAAYSYADLGGGPDLGLVRLRGVGLANMLFPWARFILESERRGLRRIAPTWRQVAHQQWIHRDRDKRWYGDLFRPGPGEISGMTRLVKLRSLVRVPESDLTQVLDSSKMVVFSGLGDFYRPLWGRHRRLFSELLSILRPSQRAAFEAAPKPTVAMHVRLGDFSREANAGFSSHVPTGTAWFKMRVEELRAAFGPVSVNLFSDGTDEELQELLSMPGVVRQPPASSIVDILSMSTAQVLIGSAGSTFSAWASFLGQQPTMWTEKMPHLDVSADLRHCNRSSHPLPGPFLDLIGQALK